MFSTEIKWKGKVSCEDKAYHTPRCAASPLLSKDTPDQPPSPERWLARIVGLRCVTQDTISETVGVVPPISARRSAMQTVLEQILLKKGMSRQGAFVW